jgi:hypothetical protein
MEDNTFSPSGDPTSLSDLLNLPASLQSVVRSLRRRPSFILADLAAVVDDPAEAEAVLAALQEHGLIKVLLARRKRPAIACSSKDGNHRPWAIAFGNS